MSKKLILYLLLSILCMITIFIFSSKNTDESNDTSKGLIYKIITVYEKVSEKEIDTETVIENLNYPIRKLAHFSIYFLLGIFIYNIFLLTKFKYKELISIIICFIYATTDETHQLFIAGRAGQPLDVFIDTLGSLLSIMIINLKSKKTTRDKIINRDN